MHRESSSPRGLGWGLSAPSGRGLLVPYSNLELSEDGDRVYRLGSWFELGPVIHIDLGGETARRWRMRLRNTGSILLSGCIGRELFRLPRESV